ncbi:MAG: DUF3892 domain-containing protein [Defluviitaleaceae bacterium]|nr:DUF3892 domain-containing protein [Defluviitaleaceae bacterium]
MKHLNNDFDSSSLAKMAIEIPTVRNGATEITALVKEEGRVIGYQLTSGMVIDKDSAVTLARQGGIKGVGISERDGNEYLKSIPDGTESNNLGNLPSVSPSWQ